MHVYKFQPSICLWYSFHHHALITNTSASTSIYLFTQRKEKKRNSRHNSSIRKIGMIGWEEVYKIVEVMVPLYVALGLGYGSVRWWGMFKPDQCDAINRFNCYFVMPLFTFQFTAGVDPYHMNFRFLGGDVVAKVMVGVALVVWMRVCRKGNLAWATTSFSLSSLNNTLVVGVPLLRAMYGAEGENLVVQSSVIQSLFWFPFLIFLLEFHRTSSFDHHHDNILPTADHNTTTTTTTTNSNNIDGRQISIEIASQVASSAVDHETLEGGRASNSDSSTKTETRDAEREHDNDHDHEIILGSGATTSNFGSTLNKVMVKLVKNPNSYASALGLIWALVAKRWHFAMPNIVEGSILIMAKAGSGVAMFTMGLFMALQEKVIACGLRLTLYGMLLRFLGGPITTAVGSLALGLHSNILHIAIVQAALPQAVASFVYAQEYGLHADVLSTAVIFGTIVSLPLLIVYYIVLDVFHG